MILEIIIPMKEVIARDRFSKDVTIVYLWSINIDDFQFVMFVRIRSHEMTSFTGIKRGF